MAKVFEIENFAKGYDDSVNEEMSSPESTQNCLNTDYTTEPGAVSKDVGERWVGDDSITYPLTGATQAIYEGTIIGSSNEYYQKKLLINDGIFYMLCDGGNFIPLGAGATLLDETALIDVTHYYRQFLIAGGKDNPVYTWDGFTNTINSLSMTISGSVDNVYRANCIESWKDRTFFGDVWEYDGADWNINENTVRWSELGDPGSMELANYNDFVDKEGNKIVRLKAYRDFLMVFKQYSLHKFTGTGGADLPFEASEIDYRTINNAPFSIAETPAGLVFLNEEGLQVTNGDTVETLPSDKKITALLRRVYGGSLPLAYAKSSDTAQEYILAVALDGSSTNNFIIAWNWKYNTWRISDKEADVLGLYTNRLGGTWESIQNYYGIELGNLNWNSSRLYPDSRDVILGKSDGYVTKRSLSYNDGSSAAATYGSATYGTSMYGGISGFDGYTCFHETPWLDLKRPGVYKEVVKLQPMWKGSAGATVTVKYRADGDSTWTSTTSDSFNSSGVIEQPFLMMRGHGRKFKFRFENNEANETFTLYRIKIFFEERSDR